MLAPAGAIAAGGLYTATEFDVRRVRPAAAFAGGDGPRRGARRPPQRRRGAADVGRHPGLPGPIRLRLRDRLRVGPDRRRSRRRRAGQPAARRARLHPEPPCRAAAVPGASLPAGGHRRENPRRHRPAATAGDSGADARLPAAGRPGLRRAGARPGLRGRRLLRAAGQAARRYPISQAIAVGIGCYRDGGAHDERSRSHRPRLAAARLVRHQLRGYRRRRAIAAVCWWCCG